jgi:hypothetical protein
VDQDGSSSLSSIVTTRINGSENDREIFPNPSDGKKLFLKSPYQGDVTFIITTVLGQEVYRNIVRSNGELIELDPNLPAGTYLLSFRTAAQVSVHKIQVR